MNNLVNDLTQKDEAKALKAAKTLIDTADLASFKALCSKSDFLFDFVKNNICTRLGKAINETNYQNINAFFKIYDETYADTLVKAMARFADENMSDEMFELLENGTIEQKKYAAKYFSIIPDTIAQEILEKYAFEDEVDLAINCAQALGAMNAEDIYNIAVSKLSTSDEFELIKTVRFLTAYGKKDAVKNLLNSLEIASTAENIAGEIPYLMPISEMLKTQNLNSVLTCIDFILLGLGELLPLSEVFAYEIYETLETLISSAHQEKNSHIAQVLLRALDKFSTFQENDEYAFDEAKDVKTELKEIFNLLAAQNENFWTTQKEIVSNELSASKQRVIAALEVIRALEIKTAANELINLIKTTNDEQVLLLATGVAKYLGCIDKLDQNTILAKVSNETSIAVLNSYFL